MYDILQVLHNVDANAAYVYGDGSFVRRIHHDDPMYEKKMTPFIENAEYIEEYELNEWDDHNPPQCVADVSEDNLAFIEQEEVEELPYSANRIALAYGIGIFAAVAINHDYIFGEDNPFDPFNF